MGSGFEKCPCPRQGFRQVSEKIKLNRTKQCKKCPWKVTTNPHDIPNGYEEEKHRNLKGTIAEPGSLMCNNHAMACHEGHEDYCIGWLINQLGPGNNIGLRMKMLKYDLSKARTVGKQHERFEDTLP